VESFALPLLAGSLLASAIGVARMRAWGVLLGALTSVLALASAATATESVIRMVMASAALPGAIMAGAILAARARVSAAPSGSAAQLRIASDPTPARLRVAAEDDSVVEEIEPAVPRRRVLTQ
jgi:hypothetical protein